MTDKLSEKEQDEICDVYMNRVMSRIAEGLDNAACAAVAMGVNQAQFLKAAMNTFNFVDRWNAASRKEEDK